MARQAKWLLGLAVPAALSLAGGCDTAQDKADRAVDENLRQAAAADPAQAHTYLDAAAKESAASPPEQLRAKAALAAAELRQAMDVSRRVLVNSARITQLAQDITSLTDAVAADNRLVATLGKYQPDPVLAAVKQQSDAIAGSDQNPDWVKTDDQSLASAAPTDKSVASLQGQASTLQQQLKAESDQRNDLLAKADQLNQQSMAAQHQASVDLFTQSADARKQAGDLAVKIDQDNSALARVKADLAVQTAQQDALKAASRGADDRTSAVNQTWSALQEQVKAVQAHSAALVGDASADVPPASPAAAKGDNAPGQPVTINVKSAQLADLLKANQGLRADAETHFTAATNFYKDAVGLATQLKTTLASRTGSGERPDRADNDAWKAEQAATDPSQYRYLLATAQLDRAEFYARAARDAATVGQLSTTTKAVLDAAKLTTPAGLDDPNGELATALQADRKTAGAGFNDANENFTNVSSGDASQELKRGARVEQMFDQYGWSLMEAAAGDAEQAGSHMTLATQARDAAVGEGAPLPTVLPTALAVPVATAAPAAGTTAPPTPGTPAATPATP